MNTARRPCRRVVTAMLLDRTDVRGDADGLSALWAFELECGHHTTRRVRCSVLTIWSMRPQALKCLACEALGLLDPMGWRKTKAAC